MVGGLTIIGLFAQPLLTLHTDPEAGIGFSECQKGMEGSLEFFEQYENRI